MGRWSADLTILLWTNSMGRGDLTILLWTNSMGRWSTAWSDSPSCLLAHFGAFSFCLLWCCHCWHSLMLSVSVCCGVDMTGVKPPLKLKLIARLKCFSSNISVLFTFRAYQMSGMQIFLEMPSLINLLHRHDNLTSIFALIMCVTLLLPSHVKRDHFLEEPRCWPSDLDWGHQWGQGLPLTKHPPTAGKNWRARCHWQQLSWWLKTPGRCLQICLVLTTKGGGGLKLKMQLEMRGCDSLMAWCWYYNHAGLFVQRTCSVDSYSLPYRNYGPSNNVVPGGWEYCIR